MLMNIVIKQKVHFIFFLVGFALTTFAGLPMIPVVILSALIAYIVYLASGNKTVVQAASIAEDSDFYEDDDLF